MLRFYRITSNHGAVDWGLWAARTPREAVRLLRAAASANPEAYSGQPPADLYVRKEA